MPKYQKAHRNKYARKRQYAGGPEDAAHNAQRQRNYWTARLKKQRTAKVIPC